MKYFKVSVTRTTTEQLLGELKTVSISTRWFILTCEDYAEAERLVLSSIADCESSHIEELEV